MTELLGQAFVLGGAAWLLWKLLRPYVVRSALDNLPGPPSHSFLYGEWTASRRILRREAEVLTL